MIVDSHGTRMRAWSISSHTLPSPLRFKLLTAKDAKSPKGRKEIPRKYTPQYLHLHLPKSRQSMGRVLGEKRKTFPKTVVTGQMLSYYERAVIKGED
jgi:hypothetical protein